MRKAGKNVEELRDYTLELIDVVGEDQVNTDKAKVLLNGVGKALATSKVQLEYSKLRKEKPNIPWLNIPK